MKDSKKLKKNFNVLFEVPWMSLAAIELGDIGLVEKQLGFILKYHNKTTGGLATFPATREKITEDPVSTAFLGWAACGLKNRELADSNLPFFEKRTNHEIENNKFWLRIAPDGSLIKTIPENAEPKEYVIRLGNEEECYYFLGASCYFLARYMETFGNGPLPLAENMPHYLKWWGKKRCPLSGPPKWHRDARLCIPPPETNDF